MPFSRAPGAFTKINRTLGHKTSLDEMEGIAAEPTDNKRILT